MRLMQNVVRKTLWVTPLAEPVSPGGRAFIPESGMAISYLARLGPARWVPDWFAARERGDITASGAFWTNWRDVVDASQVTQNLDLETFKTAIFGSATTPNFSTDTAYGVSPYDTDEKSGASWGAGGVLLTGTTVTESPTGTLMWDATDTSQVTSTFTGGEGGLIYNDPDAGDFAICLHDFGTTASPNNGTMTIAYAAGGVLNIDLTP